MSGADRGNRTPVSSLARTHSTTEPYPQLASYNILPHLQKPFYYSFMSMQVENLIRLPNPFPKECQKFLEKMRPLEGKRVKITFKSGSGSPCIVRLLHARVVREKESYRSQLAVAKIWDIGKKAIYPIDSERVLSVQEDYPEPDPKKGKGKGIIKAIFT